MDAIFGFAALFSIYIIIGIMIAKAAMLISSAFTYISRNSFGKCKKNSN